MSGNGIHSDRGEIHLGDLVRALGMLDWRSDAEAQAIAVCLGFGLPSRATPKPTTEIYDRQSYREPADPGRQAPEPRGFHLPPPPERPIALPAQQLASEPQPIGRLAASADDDEDWERDEPLRYDDAMAADPVGRARLFPDAVGRHIVSSALATLREGREIDVRRLVDRLCRLKPIEIIPRLPEATLERGCQVLLDYSPSMVPFWEDLNGLVDQVSDVVGQHSVQAYSFTEQPVEAACWTPDGKRETWAPDRRPVLVATDFGLPLKGEQRDIDPSWSALIETCERDGSPLLVLIPWAQSYWPKNLGPYPELIHWSPDTTAAQIVNAIGLGHRIEP